jgi:hypothetical protein
MKIRHGFVSNSSSSSFICDICGANAHGFDMTLEDVYMVECKKRHTFCNKHLLNITTEKVKNIIIDKLKEIEDDLEYTIEELIKMPINEFNTFIKDDIYNFEAIEFHYFIPEELCPICQMEAFMNRDLVNYLRKTNPSVLEDIKNTFKDYKEFESFLKE